MPTRSAPNRTTGDSATGMQSDNPATLLTGARWLHGNSWPRRRRDELSAGAARASCIKIGQVVETAIHLRDLVQALPRRWPRRRAGCAVVMGRLVGRCSRWERTGYDN